MDDKKRNHASNVPPETKMYNYPVGDIEVEMLSRGLGYLTLNTGGW